MTTRGNLREFDLFFVTVWFSYEAFIAFEFFGEPRVVSQNIWSTTTARHMNLLDGGAAEKRLPRDAFLQLWARSARQGTTAELSTELERPEAVELFEPGNARDIVRKLPTQEHSEL